MSTFRIQTASEQFAAHLRGELRRGAWHGKMRGSDRLAAEYGIGPHTVEAALRQLEQEGLLANEGRRRGRRIVARRDRMAKPCLRVEILGYEPLQVNKAYTTELRRRLTAAGHEVSFSAKTLTELNMKIPRISRLVAASTADAWVVGAGSLEVLEWFAAQPKPAFALFGRRQGLPIAGVGPDQVEARRAVVRRLIQLGHRRIVLLERQSQRSGGTGTAEQAVFEVMAAHGIPSGPFNLPDWEDSAGGLERVLDELFRISAPTALIIDEAFIFHATKDHLARRGIFAPDHISLVCCDPDPTFAWCRPAISHIRWDSRPVVQRIVRWAGNVARGRKDIRQSVTPVVFVEGGTIGPVKW